MSGNDMMQVVLPMFGYGPGIQGIHNNFGELGVTANFAAMTLHDLMYSGQNGSGQNVGGLQFATDTFGNLLWYVDFGGWNGYIPGRESVANSNNFQVLVENGKLPLTDTHASTVREINANDDAIRSMHKSGTWMWRILGDCDDFDLPGYSLAAVAEGESSSALAGETYESAVDEIFAALV